MKIESAQHSVPTDQPGCYGIRFSQFTAGIEQGTRICSVHGDPDFNQTAD